jgi:hypothetical protein
MGDLHYMSEKFGVAVHIMATTDAPLRQRVRHAYVGSARLGDPDLGGLGPEPSPELAERVNSLAGRVTLDGTYDTSFKVMSDDEVKEIAEEIYDINVGIEIELQAWAEEQARRSTPD